jgi:hypothetical protein
VRCGCLSAENCAADIWCPVLGGQREPVGWRAPCPVCSRPRALEYDAAAGVRWRVFCPCDRDIVRKALAGRLGDHLGGHGRRPVPPAEVDKLVTSGLGPVSLRAALLITSGMGTREALDRLGVTRTNRPRVLREIAPHLPGGAFPPPRRKESSSGCQGETTGP